MSEEQKALNVRVSDVLEMFQNGKTREEIASHYGLTLAEAKKWIFSYPKLKNKKPHKAPKVSIIDDTVDEVVVTDDTATAESNLASEDLAQELPQTAQEPAMEEVAVMPEPTQEETPVAQDMVEETSSQNEEQPTAGTSIGTW